MWCSLSFDGSLCVSRSAVESAAVSPGASDAARFAAIGEGQKTHLGTEGALAEGAGG